MDHELLFTQMSDEYIAARIVLNEMGIAEMFLVLENSGKRWERLQVIISIQEAMEDTKNYQQVQVERAEINSIFKTEPEN